MAQLEIPADLKYSATHEWVRIQGDEATIGITAFAQDELGDVVFVELPWDEAGQREVTAGGKFGEIESVKAASELFSPVAGTIMRLNGALKGQPDLVNRDPYSEGWMIVVRVSGQPDLSRLMDADAYRAFTMTAGH